MSSSNGESPPPSKKFTRPRGPTGTAGGQRAGVPVPISQSTQELEAGELKDDDNTEVGPQQHEAVKSNAPTWVERKQIALQQAPPRLPSTTRAAADTGPLALLLPPESTPASSSGLSKLGVIPRIKTVEKPAAAAKPLIEQEVATTQKVSAAAEAQSKAIVLAQRPDSGGRDGNRFRVFANHCRVFLNNTSVLYQYDVEIERSEARRRRLELQEKRVPLVRKTKFSKAFEAERNWALFNIAFEAYPEVFRNDPAVAYDRQKILITLQPLDVDRRDGLVLEVRDDKGIQYDLVLHFASVIDLNTVGNVYHVDPTQRKSTPLQALDLILRQFQFNKSFYGLQPHMHVDLSEGRELWQGYFCSLRVVQQQVTRTHDGQVSLSLNIDVTNSAFYKQQMLLDFVGGVVRRNPQQLNNNDWAKLESEIKSIRWTQDHLQSRREQKVKGFHRVDGQLQYPNQTYFGYTTADGQVRKISVQEYFVQHYGIQIGPFPLVYSGTKKNPQYSPLDVLKVAPGQRIANSRLQGKDLQQIIRHTAVKPVDRANAIRKIVNDTQLGQDPVSRAFGLEVSPHLSEIDARILQPPNIQYLGSRHGIQFGASIAEIKYVQMEEQLRDCLMYFKKKYADTLDLLIVVVPNKGGPAGPVGYDAVKLMAEVKVGLQTQCVQRKIVQDCTQRNDAKSRTTISNICLKINAKAGGINSNISVNNNAMAKFLQEEAVLYIGADCTHPAPGRQAPSVSAVCSNIDVPPNKYMGRGAPQQGRLDDIKDLKSYVTDALKTFYRGTQRTKVPSRIIYYRDGVSEGQFAEVLQTEWAAIKEACAELGDPNGDPHKTYSPPVTFITVQKRHHTRFFPQNNMNPKDQNIPPGTVVDNTITHPSEFDFFLCSHQGIQGTSKPTHYHVLRDENKFTSDQLESLTWLLCHTFVRCARSVSIPPVVYYAHLVAFRCRSYLKDQMSGMFFDTPSIVSGDSGQREQAELQQIEELRHLCKLDKSLEKKMFFA